MSEENKTPAAMPAFENAMNPSKSALAFFDRTDPDFNPDIVDYKTSTGEKRAKQDAIIAIIDKAVEEGTLTDIAAIDKEPADKLTKSAKEIIEAVESSTAFLGSFAKFAQQIKEFDFDSLGKTAQDIAGSVRRKLELAKLSPFARAFKKAVLWLTGQSRSESTLEDLRTKSKQNLLKFGEAIADLEKARDQIPAIDRSLDAQENARLDFYSDYGLYLGAVLEAYRRWKEEKLPAQQAKATESKSQLDLRAYRTWQRGVEVINSKATSMDTLHKKSLVDLDVIDSLRDALTNTDLNIVNHLTASQAQWYASVAKQQATAAISKMVETVADADRLNDEIFKDDQRLSDLTIKMAQASFEHGSLDPNLVVGFMKQKAQDALNAAQYAADRAARLEGARASLARAKDELMAAKVEAMSLKAAEKAQEDIKLLTYQPEQSAAVLLAEPAQKVPVPKQP